MHCGSVAALAVGSLILSLFRLQELFATFEARAATGAEVDVGVCACLLPRMGAWIAMQQL